MSAPKTIRYRVLALVTRHGVPLYTGAEFEIKKSSSHVHVDRWLRQGRIEKISAGDGHLNASKPTTMNALNSAPRARSKKSAAAAPGKSTATTAASSDVTRSNAKPTKPNGARQPSSIGSTFSRAMQGADAPGRLKAPASSGDGQGLRNLDPNRVVRSPFNRDEFDQVKLDELIAQVKEEGVLVPGCVRPIPEGSYVIEPGKSAGFLVRMRYIHAFLDEIDTYEVGKFDTINWEVRVVIKRAEGSHTITLSKHATDEAQAHESAGKRVAELNALKKTWPEPKFFKTREEAEASVPLWEIVYGERRWLAAKATGQMYPAIVRDLNDTEALEQQAKENMQREDLNAVDEAIKFDQLRTAYEAEGLTKGQAIARIHERTGMGESTIYQRLTLLTLSAELLAKVRSGALPPSHAELVTKVESVAAREQLAELILKPKDVYEGDGFHKVSISFREAKSLADEAAKAEEKEKKWQALSVGYAAKGYKVLTLEQGAKLCFNWGQLKATYVGVNDKCDLDAKGRTWKALLGDHAPQVIVAHDSYASKDRVLYPRKGAEKGLALAGHKFATSAEKEESKEAKAKREKEKREAEEAKKFAIDSANIGKIVAAVEAREPNAEYYRLLLGQLSNNDYASEFLLRRRGIALDEKKNSYQAARIATQEFVAKSDGKTLRGILLELFLWSYYGADKDAVAAAAKLYKVKLQTSGKGGADAE